MEGGGVHTWKWNGPRRCHSTQLHIFQDPVNPQPYIDDALQLIVVPFFRDHEDLQVFQQDSARAHTTRASRTFFFSNNKNSLLWTSQRFHGIMTPIEYLCGRNSATPLPEK